MYTVVRQVQIPVLTSRVWECLTQPAHLARWFADAERLEPGRPFRLDFGDGDFFAGTVAEWDEPGCLRLEWKFMDLGARYTVAFFLTPLDGPVTELSVVDRGCLTLDELNSLREGWTDFLGRLALYARTGETARFTWSETIGIVAVVPGPGELPACLRSDGWWQSAFPDAQVRTSATGDGRLRAAFRCAAWGGAATEAQIALERVPAGACLSVQHQGWPHLPEGVALAERRRYAGLWQQALQSLEAEAGEEAVAAAPVAAPRRAARAGSSRLI